MSSGSPMRRQRCVAVVAEEEEQPVDHEEVPLERHRQREHRGDVQVEEDHPDDRDGPDRVVVDGDQEERPEELLDGAEVGDRRGHRRRPHVLGVVTPEPALERPRLDQRGVAHHRRDDEGEVVVELRRRRSPPDEEEAELPGHDPVLDREEPDRQDRCVDLRPRSQERDLVTEPEQSEQPKQNGDAGGWQLARRAGGRIDSGCGQQEDRGGEHPRVEPDVQERAGGSLGEGNPVRPGRQPDGAGAQPVEDATDRRHEAEAERHRSRTKPEDLPEQHPDSQLLEDDRLGPPVAEIAECAEARRQRDHEQRAHAEDEQLEDVDEVDEGRRTEPVDAPVLNQRLEPRQVRLRLPLLQLERRG